MSIVYGAVTCRTTILGQAGITNEPAVAKLAQEVISSQVGEENKSQQSLVYGDKLFIYYVTDNGITYLCIADKGAWPNMKRFISSLKEEVTRSISEEEMRKATPQHYSEDLGQIIRNTVNTYNNPKGDRVSLLRNEIGETQRQIEDSIKIVIDRGDNLDETLLRTEEMSTNSQRFHQFSTRIRWAMRKRAIILGLVVALIIIAVIVAIVVMAVKCHGLKC